MVNSKICVIEDQFILPLYIHTEALRQIRPIPQFNRFKIVKGGSKPSPLYADYKYYVKSCICNFIGTPDWIHFFFLILIHSKKKFSF